MTEDRSVGSDRYRAVGSCRGKGEAEDWSVGSDRWVYWVRWEEGPVFVKGKEKAEGPVS